MEIETAKYDEISFKQMFRNCRFRHIDSLKITKFDNTKISLHRNLEVQRVIEFEIIISFQSQPPWLARPVYGVAAPIIILVTLITNTFVVVVLSNKNLRTPTNHILLSMAITELMTGRGINKFERESDKERLHVCVCV